jgi:hypothetical protein
MSCEFIPDACSAAAMQAILLAYEYLGVDFNVGGLEADFSGTADLSLEARLVLNDQHQYLLDAFAAAYAAAGCTMPPVPSLPPAPDFSGCQQQIDAVKQQLASPLGWLSSVISIQLDANKLPVKITVL